MDYFKNNYSRINYPIASDKTRGLRNAQLGAIHAIGSHFTLYNQDAALVVMPTGSGKTAVLNLAPYLLRSQRVLIISSSILVRGQIYDEMTTLKTLKDSNVFHRDLPVPNVKELKKSIRSNEDWEELRNYDVVVAIPGRLQTGMEDGLTAPQDLFDLVLVDEAHHVPAYTWTTTVKAFPNANKIYFTATPFRRDKREIEGRMAFNYPLSKAYDDKIFGDIGYYPIQCEEGKNDITLALEAEKIFNADRAAGLEHFLMVRTDSRVHAEELNKLYQANTKLKLQSINSSKSYKYIIKTVERLKNKELDGVICVDMLGEGFDFPNLKIAAIHKPHKSLAVTLQFIGRFARTNAENIGEAKFIAVPNDIEIGRKQLYGEGSIWNNIIKDLSENTILEEDEIKTTLDTFELKETDAEKGKISFYNLNPYFHLKIYKADGFNIDGNMDFLGHETVYHGISREANTAIFITKETTKPKWISTDDLVDTNYFFFLAYFDQDTNLLFLHSSIKTRQFYDLMVEEFATGEKERIAKYDINKVLAYLEDPAFFNIGMQNRSPNSGESYRTLAGPNAEKTIRESHGRMYANGHVFGKAKSDGKNITIGYSSGSKIWSNMYQKIPLFIKWCKHYGAKIASDVEVKTNTGLDNLSMGRVVTKFPLPVHSATWNKSTFSAPPVIYEVTDEGEIIGDIKKQLLDFSIIIRKDECTEDEMCFDITDGTQTISLKYDFENYYQYKEEHESNFIIEVNAVPIDMIEYLNDCSFHVFLEDFAIIENHEYHGPPKAELMSFNPERIIPFDWSSTDITKEFYETPGEKVANGNVDSIHETIEADLRAKAYPVTIYDHGTKEIADFITMTDLPEKVEINLVHIKGTSSIEPGDRVKDVYEVCMQAVKSQVYTLNKQIFKSKIIKRTNGKPGKFISGNIAIFNRIIDQNKRLVFKYTIVQPGVSKDTLSVKLSTTFAASDDSLQNNGSLPIEVIGS